MPTVLITGTSTGIGHAACELFANRGWTVLAGSRKPAHLAFASPGIVPTKIDVNDAASIEEFFRSDHAKDLTCVVNNAGYGMLLPFEDTPAEEIEKLFRTNVFGLMEVTRRAARLFREKRGGTIVNISSVIGRIGAPFYAAYCASKFAVEGFSEALSHELKPFNVHVKLVEPGGTRTQFHPVAYATEDFPITDAYREWYGRKRASHDRERGGYDRPEEVAEVILAAASDGEWRLRYPLRSAKQAAWTRWLLGDEGLWKKLCGRFGS